MIFTKQDFTVNDLLEETAELGNDVLILNSNWTTLATEKFLETESHHSFQPIVGMYDDKTSDISCIFDWDAPLTGAKALWWFRDFAEKLENKEIPLNRVEDGYKLANYENIVYNDKHIVLC